MSPLGRRRVVYEHVLVRKNRPPRTPADVGYRHLRLLASFGAARDRLGNSGIEPEALDSVRKFITRYDWRELVAALAHVNGRALSDRGGVASIDPALRAAFAAVDVPEFAWLRRFLELEPTSVVANEAAATFLIGLALLDAGEAGLAPDHAGLALLFLAANDHALEFRRPRERHGRSASRRFADMLVAGARSQLFNRHPDAARALVRVPLLLERYPSLPVAVQTMGDWDALQRAAFFGLAPKDYVAQLAGPLALIAHLWGTEAPQTPIFDPHSVFAETKISRELLAQFCDSLTIDREAAAAELRASMTDGTVLPRVTFPFRRPLLRFDEKRVACVSPTLLAAQLHSGMIARLRAAANTLHGSAGGSALMTVIGHLTEAWARECVDEAARVRPEVAQWIVPRDALADEITDVALRSRRNVILFEVKCRTLREDLLKGADDARALEEWYVRFLFGGPGEYGALGQLGRAVRRIREGQLEAAGVPRDATVFPVVVYLDDLNLDHPGVFSWLRHACDERHVLQDAAARRPTFMDIATFETFIAWVGEGNDPFALLERWCATPDASDGRFEVLLRERAGKPVRSPIMQREFADGARAMHEALFGPLPEGWSLPTP